MGLELNDAALSEGWIAELVAAAAERGGEVAGADVADSAGSAAGPGSAVVALTIGKKRAAALSLVDGEVVGGVALDAPPSVGDMVVVGDDQLTVAVVVPTTDAQLADLLAGRDSMAQAYMRGDLKPVGAIGSFLPLVELVESLSQT